MLQFTLLLIFISTSLLSKETEQFALYLSMGNTKKKQQKKTTNKRAGFHFSLFHSKQEIK